MKNNITIKNLPMHERPRERLIELGPRSLSSQELLAIILQKGVKGESVLIAAQKLLSHYGSLSSITEASLEDLQTAKGLGIAKACQLLACAEIARRIQQENQNTFYDRQKTATVISPSILAPMIRSKLGELQKEHCMVITFNVRCKIIAIDTVGIGILNANLIHPREVFNTAIKRHAASIIIAHNHPSGDSEPSDEDSLVTERIASSGRVLGIELLDHLVITSSGYFSFKERGLL